MWMLCMSPPQSRLDIPSLSLPRGVWCLGLLCWSMLLLIHGVLPTAEGVTCSMTTITSTARHHTGLTLSEITTVTTTAFNSFLALRGGDASIGNNNEQRKRASRADAMRRRDTGSFSWLRLPFRPRRRKSLVEWLQQENLQLEQQIRDMHVRLTALRISHRQLQEQQQEQSRATAALQRQRRGFFLFASSRQQSLQQQQKEEERQRQREQQHQKELIEQQQKQIKDMRVQMDSWQQEIKELQESLKQMEGLKTKFESLLKEEQDRVREMELQWATSNATQQEQWETAQQRWQEGTKQKLAALQQEHEAHLQEMQAAFEQQLQEERAHSKTQVQKQQERMRRLVQKTAQRHNLAIKEYVKWQEEQQLVEEDDDDEEEDGNGIQKVRSAFSRLKDAAMTTKSSKPETVRSPIK